MLHADNHSQSEAPVPTWRSRDSQIAPPSRPPPPKPSGAANVLRCGPGLAMLLAVNAGVYAAAVWGGKATTVATMVLPAVNAKWWQVGRGGEGRGKGRMCPVGGFAWGALHRSLCLGSFAWAGFVTRLMGSDHGGEGAPP